MSEQVLELRLPSIRLFPNARYRCLKMRDDKRAWAERWQRVQEMQAAGWQVVRAEVGWGNRSRPGTKEQRYAWYASIMDGVPALECEDLGAVNGMVRVVLQRESLWQDNPMVTSES